MDTLILFLLVVGAFIVLAVPFIAKLGARSTLSRGLMLSELGALLVISVLTATLSILKSSVYAILRIRNCSLKHNSVCDNGDLAKVPRVLIIGASVGAGHDIAARVQAGQLRQRGVEVIVCDYLDALPWSMYYVMRLYSPGMKEWPTFFDWMFGEVEHPGWVQSVTLLFCRQSEPMILKWASRVDAVVSTYPLASQAIGRLRTLGQLNVPTATYISETSIHPIWCHPRVDRHFSSIKAAAPTGKVYGVTVHPVALLADSRFHNCRTAFDRGVIRKELGICADGTVVLISGGSLGLGQIVASVEAVLCQPEFQVIVLCGRNDKLRNTLTGRGRVIALGFREDVPKLYAAADVLIINSGGMSFNEAMVAGLPTIMYLELGGHGRTSAALLHDAGLVPWPKSSDELLIEIEKAIRCKDFETTLRLQENADATTIILDLIKRA